MAEQSRADQDVAARAKKRFEDGASYEQDFRTKYANDISFMWADSDNQDQWPDSVKTARSADQKPMLTLNKVHTHVAHVVNEMRENRPRISVHPTNTQANYEAAEVFGGLIRHIENASNADDIYAAAMLTLTAGGYGVWRVLTEYESENTFDQVIRIRQIKDPMTCVCDPYTRRPDGADMRWAVIYEDMPQDQFNAEFPGEADTQIEQYEHSPLTADCVRVIEFFEREEKTEWLYRLLDDSGNEVYIRKSKDGDAAVEIAKAAWEASREAQDGAVDRRRVSVSKIHWYKIANGRVLEKTEWAGKYIPVVRVTAIEHVMNGKLDRKGMVRFMKDAQRMYNYNASAAVEFGALQSKSPYIAPVEAVYGFETQWRTANSTNHSYLPYNSVDDAGNPIQRPERQQPPTGAPVFAQGMMDAERQLMMTSGQYEATFSEQGNEVSGKAILERKSQGNRVTFHYLSRLAIGIAYTGRLLIDLIPHIYDTKRVVRVLGEDGTSEQQITIDPNAQQPLTEAKNNQESEVESVFNPSVGEYDVVALVGPNYETRRKDAFDHMTQVLSSNGELMQVFGDLWMQQADFPQANKLAERIRNWIPSNIINGQPSPMEQQLQQQNQQLQQQVQSLTQQLTEKFTALKLEDKRIDMDYLNHTALRVDNDIKGRINGYKAETERLKALGNGLTPEMLAPIITNFLIEVLNGPEVTPPPQNNVTDAANVMLENAGGVLDDSGAQP